jgi:phage shock protein A
MSDPKAQLLEASQQIREALRNLRESVVQAVMRRNLVQDQITKTERLIADLETKADLAEKIHNDDLAVELRREREGRIEELNRLRVQLATAEAE